jgi:hypothetical protein
MQNESPIDGACAAVVRQPSATFSPPAAPTMLAIPHQDNLILAILAYDFFISFERSIHGASGGQRLCV